MLFVYNLFDSQSDLYVSFVDVFFSTGRKGRLKKKYRPNNKSERVVSSRFMK